MFGLEAARLYVTVGVDGMNQYVNDMNRAGALVDKVGNSTATVTLGADTSGAVNKIDELVAKYEAAGGSKRTLMLLADPSPAMRAIGEVSARVDALKSKMHSLAMGGSLGTFAQDLASGTGLRGAIGGVVSKVGGGMATGGFGGGLQAGIAALGPIGIAGLGAAAVGGFALMKAGEQERFQTQLSVLLGGVDKAKARIAELTQFAATTPFELPEVVNASKTLQVFTGDALSSGKALRLIGDVAAGTGSNFGETAMWFGRMYDAMKSGRPFGEATMRLQEMGAIGGKSREVIESLAQKVKDGSMTMEQAWAAAEGEFGRFSGMMEKQSGTLEGKLSNLSDALGQAGAKLGNILLPVAKLAVDGLIAIITVVGNLIGMLGDLFGWVGQITGAFVDWVASMPFVQDALNAISDAVDFVGGAIDGFTKAVGDGWDYVTGKTEQMARDNKAIMATVNADWHKAFREGERDISEPTKAIANALPNRLNEARLRAIEIAKQSVVDIAQALRDHRSAWQKAIDDLEYDLEHKMTTAAEVAAIKGELAAINASKGWKSGDPVLIASLAATKKILEDRLDELAPAAGAAGRAAMDALGSILRTDPGPSQAAIDQARRIEDQFLRMPGFDWAAGLIEQWIAGAKSKQGALTRETLLISGKIAAIDQSDNAYEWGKNLMIQYAKGIADFQSRVMHQGYLISGKISNLLRLASPAKEGPLSEGGGPEGWGERGADLYARGWSKVGSGLERSLRGINMATEAPGNSAFGRAGGAGFHGEETRANAVPGGLHVEIHNIDARGSTDPEATRRSARRGVMDAVAEGLRQQNARLPQAAAS